MKIVLIILISLVGLLILGNIFTTWMQHLFIMWPIRRRKSFKFSWDGIAEELWLEGPMGGKLNCVRFRTPPEIRKGIVLYFHGNSGSLEKWGECAEEFTSRGWDVFIPDYRGFGKSTGKRTPELMYQDAQIAYSHVKKEFSAENIIIYGRSLGSGMASNLATRVAARHLVLETPFASIPDLFYVYYPFLPKVFLFRYTFYNDRALEEISMPVTVLHGTKDKIVPYKSAMKLKKYMKDVDEFVTIFNGKHGDLANFPEFQEKMDEIFA